MKSSGTTLLRTILAVVLAVPLALSLALMNIGVAPGSAAAAGPETLVLVHQELAVEPEGKLAVTIHLSAPLPVGSQISVRAYRAITLRDQLKRAIAHQLSGFISNAVVDPATIVPDAAGNLPITVQTTSGTDTSAGQLRLPGAGLYPVLVAVTSATGVPLGDLVTFAYRLPDPPTVLGQLSIAVLASITAPPSITATAAPTALPAEVTAQLAQLDAYQGVKVSLQISPNILSRLDDAGRAALGTAMTGGFVMSQPIVPIDPSSAVASGLDDQFINLLTQGETALAATGVLPHYNSTVWYAPDSITNAGALLLRNKRGVQLLVVPSTVYRAAGGNLGEVTDYSQLFKAVLSDSDPNSDADQTCESLAMQCVSTAVIDPLLASRFSDTSLSDEQAALYTAADVVAYREQFSGNLSPSLRHALILGLDGEGVASAKRMNRSVAMLALTGAANFITLDAFQESSGALINDGQQVELQLPQPKSTIDLTHRAKDLDDVTLAATTVASMLVDNTARGDAWLSSIGSLYSTAITDDQADAAIDSVNAQLQQIRSCIVPPDPYQFTLAGQSTTLFLRLRNDCPEPLHVLIQMTADANKLNFPDGIVDRNLDPGVTNLPVKVEARTNGTFKVTLDILTPAGKLPIVPTLNLRARVNTLTGLPQLITGVGLLLLLTWWVRNLRRSRRVQRAVAGRTDHPATKPVPEPPDPLLPSPDATG